MQHVAIADPLSAKHSVNANLMPVRQLLIASLFPNTALPDSHSAVSETLYECQSLSNSKPTAKATLADSQTIANTTLSASQSAVSETL
ncbi:hypothetical protein BaRGS_00022834 [Batillaria attramentaria]|uniref:Uncharacterized protein n=1 Tax=Batillaria attramentaria TaxID=370345 RepID=A0ABD0KFN7_9CAEN